jgi:hypothetical protein
MRPIVFVLLLAAPCLASAHGLLIDAETNGATITGTVYYTNGDLGVNESVALLDLTIADGKPPVSGTTDSAGRFSFPVIASHRYRVSAYGEEGHNVDLELIAEADARPEFIDLQSASADPSWLPPAWAVIGGALLLSLVPTLILRKRRAG